MVKYDCKLRKMTIYTASFCIVTTTVLIVLGNQLKSMEMNPTSWLTTEKKSKKFSRWTIRQSIIKCLLIKTLSYSYHWISVSKIVAPLFMLIHIVVYFIIDTSISWINLYKKEKKKSLRHSVFPGGHPSKY